MKFYLVLFLLSCQVLQAQEFVPFNRGYIASDSIVKMQIRSETVSIFFWTDTIFANEKTTNIYDIKGNLINQKTICELPCRSTIQIRTFDKKNRMTEDSRYYYPATPISKNIYIFNDDTMPLKMEIVGYQYTEGILNNFSRHISLYNEKGHLLDYKNYDQNGTMIRHEKYLLDAVGIRSATINFTNNDKDSIIIYKEEDYGLPFNNTISDYNSLVKSDTIEYLLDDGSKMLYIYEAPNVPVNISSDLVEIKTYYPNGLIRENRKLNQSIIRFEYQFY